MDSILYAVRAYLDLDGNPHLLEYCLLVEQGILYKRRGIGMFVAPGAGQAVRASRQAAFYKRFVCPMVKEAAGLGLTVQQLNEMVARAAEEVKQ